MHEWAIVALAFWAAQPPTTDLAKQFTPTIALRTVPMRCWYQPSNILVQVFLRLWRKPQPQRNDYCTDQ